MVLQYYVIKYCLNVYFHHISVTWPRLILVNETKSLQVYFMNIDAL